MPQVLNSIHQILTGGVGMFRPEQMTPLASGRNVSAQYLLTPEDQMLNSFGLRSGLVGNSYGRYLTRLSTRSPRKISGPVQVIDHTDNVPIKIVKF